MMKILLTLIVVVACSMVPLAAGDAPGPFTVPPPYPVDGFTKKDDCLKALSTYYQAQEAAYKAIATKLQAAIDEGKQTLASLEAGEKAIKDLITSTRTDLAKYEAAQAAAFNQAQATINRLTNLVQRDQVRIQADQAAMAGLDPNKPADAAKIARLQADINRLNAEVNQSQAQIAAAQATIAAIQAERARLKKIIDDAQKLLDELAKAKQTTRAKLVLDTRNLNESDSAWRITKKQWDDQAKMCKDKE